jgi:hypothetical protein
VWEDGASFTASPSYPIFAMLAVEKIGNNSPFERLAPVEYS